MIPNNDVLNQLQSLIRTSAPPLLEVADHPAEMPQWVPGQKLTATVLANLPNGRFQVMVSDMLLDMNLPRNTQPGEKFDLTFIAAQPRLTFALSRDLEGAAQTQSSVKLSEAAKFLGGLLERASQMSAKNEASPLQETAPLLLGEPADSKSLAQTLHTAVAKSGLFYESHQAQWVSGQRALSDLLSEPQGKLSPLLKENVSAGLAPGDTTRNATLSNDTPPSVAPHSTPENEKVHTQTLPLVQQQLDVLDTRTLVWQGQVWPNQDMRWEIGERPAREGGDEDTPVWQTRLRLQMPHLGDVTAYLAMGNGGIRLDIEAKAADAEQQMRDAQTALTGAFEAAGLHLTGVSIHGREPR
jgi:hypothetical protein